MTEAPQPPPWVSTSPLRSDLVWLFLLLDRGMGGRSKCLADKRRLFSALAVACSRLGRAREAAQGAALSARKKTAQVRSQRKDGQLCGQPPPRARFESAPAAPQSSQEASAGELTGTALTAEGPGHGVHSPRRVGLCLATARHTSERRVPIRGSAAAHLLVSSAVTPYAASPCISRPCQEHQLRTSVSLHGLSFTKCSVVKKLVYRYHH